MRLNFVAAGSLALVAGLLALVATGANAQDMTAAGSTFSYPIYNKWFTEYNRLHPKVEINYQSIGSGGGIRQVSQGTVDFGASDMPVSDAVIAQARIKFFNLPTVLGAVVPVYNIPGVGRALNFSGDVIADIFLGRITRWNDPRLVKDNPGVHLPDKMILPVHRSDGSGTTFIFTDFLSKVSPQWASKVGRNTSVDWPAGIGAKGNEGVAGMVRQTPGSFGYVALNYALENKMPFGAVKNAAGNFLLGSIQGVTAAAASQAKAISADYRASITNAPGADSYPISSFTYLLIPLHIADPAKAAAIRGFLTWMLDYGESQASKMGYAPLPDSVMAMERRTIATIR